MLGDHEREVFDQTDGIQADAADSCMSTAFAHTFKVVGTKVLVFGQRF
jgi:hypothetical protein